MSLKEDIKKLAKLYHQEIIEIRRHLHQFPELSFQEVNTGKFIAKKLTEYGIPYEHGVAENGVVGLIKGKNPHKTVVALRGDIDALPILEANDVPYKSKNEGVMHACGHDVHTSSVLGAAKILNTIKNRFEGTIKLIFQPGEEKLPGGASIMIKEGVLENPMPNCIFGQHVHPEMEAGLIGFKAGNFMASNDGIYITIRGKSGHGALPHACIDPIVIASNIVVSLQQLVSRHANPTHPTVLTFGQFRDKDGSSNIIPSEVNIVGTFRTLNEDWRYTAHQKMQEMVIGIAQAMGGICEFTIEKGIPCLVNDTPLTNRAKKNAEAYVGAENVVDLPARMASEDFANFSQQLPACFYRLGTSNAKRGIISNVHTPTFDIEEKVLELSIGLMAWLAIQELAVA